MIIALFVARANRLRGRLVAEDHSRFISLFVRCLELLLS